MTHLPRNISNYFWYNSFLLINFKIKYVNSCYFISISIRIKINNSWNEIKCDYDVNVCAKLCNIFDFYIFCIKI